MSRRWVGSVLLWAALIAGCGGSAGNLAVDETPEWSAVPPPLAVGKVELSQQSVKAQQLSMEISRLRYTARDAEGNLVYGPLEGDWQAQITLEHVPITAQSLTIEALSSEDSSVIGKSNLRMMVRDGQTVSLSNPAFESLPQRFTALRVTPGSAPLMPGQSTNLRAFGTAADGSEIDLTQRVRWFSSAPSRLRVGNTPGQRGRAVSLDDIQGDVTVGARFLTDQILMGQIGPNGLAGMATIDPDGGDTQPFSEPLGTQASLTTMDMDNDGQEEVAHSDGSLVSCVDIGGLERWAFEPWEIQAGSTLNLSSDDLDGDGHEDLVVAGLRADGRPQVAAYDGQTLVDPKPRRLFVLGGLSNNFVTGVNLASGQDGDGTPALVIGAGPERSPEVRVYRLVRGDTALQPVLIRRFLAFDATQRGGARVALGDVDADGVLELLTATGPGELPRLRASLLATGQQLWMANLGNSPSFDGVTMATGQLFGSSGDDVAASVTYRTPDQKGSVFVLDGPKGRKVRAYEVGSGQRALLAAGNISGPGLVATSDLRLTTARPSRLEFVSSSVRLDAAETDAQLVVRARFSDGQILDVTDLVDFSLASGDREAVHLDPRGKVTALSRGTVGVRADYGGLSASATVDSATEPRLKTLSITPVGARGEVATEVPFRVYASLQGGKVVDFTDRAVWSSDTESVVSVSNLPGRHGVGVVIGEGTSMITAVDPRLEVSATMPFHAVPHLDIVGLSVEPRNFLLGRQERQRMKMIAHYEDGSSRPLTSGVRWRTSDPALNVDGSGEVTSGDRPVSATVMGTVKGVDGSATAKVRVDVPAPRLVSLACLPGELTLRPDASLQLHVAAQYDRGEPVTDPQGISYSSSDPSAVAVNSGGLVRAGGIVGSAEITVLHSGGVRTVVPVRVEAMSPSLLSLDLDLDADSIADGVSTAATVSGTFSTGPIRNLTAATAWTSSNPSVVTVSADGAITALAPGVAVVRASHPAGMFAESTLTITQAKLLAASVGPRNPGLSPGDKAVLTLLGSFTDGRVRPLVEGTTWTSLNTTVFAFGGSRGGAGTAGEPGLATVLASHGEVTASLPVRVLER